MAVTEAQKRYLAKYDKKTVGFFLRFRKGADADIIEWLRAQPCKTAYIRDLIKADIDGEK